MEINIQNTSISIEHNDEQLGIVTFVHSQHFFILDNTLVSKDSRGIGVGKLLIEAFVDHARRENMKVLPLCPFAKSQFDKSREFIDVLYFN